MQRMHVFFVWFLFFLYLIFDIKLNIVAVFADIDVYERRFCVGITDKNLSKHKKLI